MAKTVVRQMVCPGDVADGLPPAGTPAHPTFSMWYTMDCGEANLFGHPLIMSYAFAGVPAPIEPQDLPVIFQDIVQRIASTVPAVAAGKDFFTSHEKVFRLPRSEDTAALATLRAGVRHMLDAMSNGDDVEVERCHKALDSLLPDGKGDDAL